MKSSEILIILGCTIAQLRMVFIPNYYNPATPRIPLAYVQPFKLAYTGRGRTGGIIDACRFKRIFRSDNKRKGLIIPLTQIWRPIQLIPVFGKACNVNWTCDNAVEQASTFIVDNYFCLSDFIDIYSGIVG